MVWERRDPNEPLDWEEGWEALTTVWTKPCFGAYAVQQPPERRTNYTPRDFTEAYTIVWDLATQRVPWNFAEELYGHYQQALARFARQHASNGLGQSTSDDRCLLLEFCARWAQHRALTRDYHRAFVILDRYYVKHNGLVPLEQAGHRCFWNAACTPAVRTRLHQAALDLVEQHRAHMLIHTQAQQQKPAAVTGGGKRRAVPFALAPSAEAGVLCGGVGGGGLEGEGKGVMEPPASPPGPAEMGAALVGLAVASLFETCPPEAWSEFDGKLRVATGQALDGVQVMAWGKAEGWQDLVLARPFPGVLPLGPSQVSYFYRLHLQKLRCLSEGLVPAQAQQPQQPQPPTAAPVPALLPMLPPLPPVPAAAAADIDAMDESQGPSQGPGGMVMTMDVDPPVAAAAAAAAAPPAAPRMTIHAPPPPVVVVWGKGEGDGMARCQLVLKEVVEGMGDDVFRELLDHLHVL